MYIIIVLIGIISAQNAFLPRVPITNTTNKHSYYMLFITSFDNSHFQIQHS